MNRETCRPIRVETTKQAKAKYKKSSGQQWNPTKGQINAADIWNKQEEQLRKGREREEKRRKAVSRQAERDARLKEIENEMLRKGRITVEDTWGKISASQNRLHKFFGAPACQSDQAEKFSVEVDYRVPDLGGKQFSDLPDINQDAGCSQTECTEVDVLRENRTQEARNEPSRLQHDHSFRGSAIQSGSQITGHKRKRDFDLPTPGSQGLDKTAHANLQSAQVAPDELHQHTCVKGSINAQSLMPPPPRPQIQNADGTDFLVKLPMTNSPVSHNQHEAARRPPTYNRRQPLGEMSESQLNIRRAEKPNPEEICQKSQESSSIPCGLVSTEIVNEILGGLSSQDLEIDFDEEDKENSSPLRRLSSEGTEKCSLHQHLSPSKTSIDGTDAAKNHTDHISDDQPEDEFFDAEIDPETLMLLAATQRFEDGFGRTAPHPLQRASVNFHEEGDEPVNTIADAANQISDSPTRFWDSFGFSDIDESDLFECLDDFESQKRQEDLTDAELLSFIEKFEQARKFYPASYKKRESLPWDKYPVATSNSQTEVPQSQQTEVLSD